MANREENIKKINEELEQLSDEQLEQVAGGSWAETAADSVFLKKLGLLDKSYSAGNIAFNSDTSREQKVYDAFQKLGIGLSYSGWGENHYYFGQQCLSHEEAHAVAESQAKRLKLGIYK